MYKRQQLARDNDTIKDNLWKKYWLKTEDPRRGIKANKKLQTNISTIENHFASSGKEKTKTKQKKNRWRRERTLRRSGNK